ncbi:MAG: MFS transporter [Eggerthellaceae bacterium]|nr:MFS transporter [Eggerthellaceae bacterium]
MPPSYRTKVGEGAKDALPEGEAAFEEAEAEITAEIAMAPQERQKEEKFAEGLEGTHSPKNPKGGWLSNLIEVGALPISIVNALVYFAYSSVLTFLTPYSEQIGLEQAASIYFIFYAASMFVTRPFIGRAFDRKGPRTVMVPSFISVILGMILLAMSVNAWILLISALFLGFGIGNIASCGVAMAVRITPANRINFANASFYILLDAGVGIGPTILGVFTPLLGYSLTFLCMGGIVVAGLVLFFIVSRNYAGKVVS